MQSTRVTQTHFYANAEYEVASYVRKAVKYDETYCLGSAESNTLHALVARTTGDEEGSRKAFELVAQNSGIVGKFKLRFAEGDHVLKFPLVVATNLPDPIQSTIQDSDYKHIDVNCIKYKTFFNWFAQQCAHLRTDFPTKISLLKRQEKNLQKYWSKQLSPGGVLRLPCAMTTCELARMHVAFKQVALAGVRVHHGARCNLMWLHLDEDA